MSTTSESTQPKKAPEFVAKRPPGQCSGSSYLVGGGGIPGRVRSQVGELLLQLVVGAVAEAVDHGGGQQHGRDAQDGHHGENQELGGLGLAVLGGDLADLVGLQRRTGQTERQKVSHLCHD